MWSISADEARKISEVIFVVLPLFALADLVEGGTALGRSTSGRGALHAATAATSDTEVRALSKAVLFYCGFVASAALALTGLLITPSPGFLAAQITVFAMTTYFLFSQIGDQFMSDLVAIYAAAGGPRLAQPGRRISARDTARVLRTLFTHRQGEGEVAHGMSARVARHRRRVALFCILAVPTLTTLFAVFVVGIDVALCWKAKVS
jgi:hypothetical protein